MKISKINNDLVLVKMDNVSKYVGSIYIPTEEKSVFGTVVKVGTNAESFVKENDRVVVDKHVGIKFPKLDENDESEYNIYNVDDIFAVVGE